MVQLLHYWLFVAFAIAGTQGDCNVCSSVTNTACISDTQFQFCSNNLPSGTVSTCPDSTVCTSQTIICQANSANVPKACNDCNVCNQNRTFACTGARTFALCLGTDVISSITGSCQPFHVCNLNYQYICGNVTQGVQASCSFLPDGTTTSTTSATPTTLDPTAYCQIMQRAGRYPYGIILTSSCRQYILCYLFGGNWYGALYTCPGSTYFDSSAAICTVALPARCSAAVQSLQLSNLNLN